MQTPEAARLAQTIIRKEKELRELCQGIDEDTACRAPSERWSPKEILSHLCGPEAVGMLPTIRAFIEEDTPLLDLQAEDAFFSEKRARMTFAELLDEFGKEYDRMAETVAGLSEEQLSRKANIPMLKESPLGEYPTLSRWIEALGDYHLGWHTNHMREVLDLLDTASESRPESASRKGQEPATLVV